MKKLMLAVALAVVTSPAAAILQLAVDINGTIFFCADNTACDSNATVGQLNILNQTINGVEIVGSSQFAAIGSTNFLNTSSFQFINHNLFDTSVQLAIGGTNFLGPVTAFAASGSGTWQQADGSNIALSWYADAANGQGADNPLDFPGILLATFADAAVGAADAFSYATTGPFAGPNPFHSMTLGTSGVLDAWDGAQGTETVLVGRSQTLITTQVPEPATLALMGLGLVGMGFMRRKRTR